jgi:hypothetical protein
MTLESSKYLLNAASLIAIPSRRQQKAQGLIISMFRVRVANRNSLQGYESNDQA